MTAAYPVTTIDTALPTATATTTPALAARSARLAAVIVDTVLAFAGFLPILIAEPDHGVNDGTVELAIGCLLLVGLTQLVLLSLSGQTIGKKLMGIRIVAQNGERAGFWRAVVLRIWVFNLVCMIPYVGLAVCLFDPLCIFGKDRRCLHDEIAGTRVVCA